MKPALKTPLAPVAVPPVQMHIDDRLLADAAISLRGRSSGRKIQLTSLRPGGRLCGPSGRVAYVAQNWPSKRLLELQAGAVRYILPYDRAAWDFDTYQRRESFSWWRKVLVAMGVYR